MRIAAAVPLIATGLAALAAAGSAPAHAAGGQPVFGGAIKLAGADGDTEPRVAVTPDDRRWVISNSNGTAVVYGSPDGGAWTQAPAAPAAQSLPSIDVDIVATRTGRLIASELDFGGINFRTSYSDDQGRTWTPVAGPTGQAGPTTGTGYADSDRQWFAVGPDDPTTHLPRVYMLMHNLLSGAASHNMYVATSTDNGASFGPLIPVTLPGTQAWADLQCADSGGPSNIFVNPRDGRVYTVFGTRSSAAGGCGASVTGSFEINVVAATRVWVATAPAAGSADPSQWQQSLAVDDNATGQIVGMQLAPGAIDGGDNLYIAYPESPHAYPDYNGAAIKYVHTSQTALLAHTYGITAPATTPWSAPVQVAPGGGAGHLLPHIVAGDAGQIDLAYFTGENVDSSGKPDWFMTVAQSLNALDTAPVLTEQRLSSTPTYSDIDASHMMGACGSGPAAGVENGFACGRSTDVWGIALDHAGRLIVSWPGDGPNAGTYVDTQLSGPAVIAAPPANVPDGRWAALLLVVGGAAMLVVRRRRAGKG